MMCVKWPCGTPAEASSAAERVVVSGFTPDAWNRFRVRYAETVAAYAGPDIEREPWYVGPLLTPDSDYCANEALLRMMLEWLRSSQVVPVDRAAARHRAM